VRTAHLRALRSVLVGVAAVVGLVVGLAASEARADDAKKDAPPAASKADEASQRFRSGVGFYKDRDFAAALAEFKRAYELLPNYGVLYNLGQTARELKDYAAALTAFDQYLRDGGTKVPAARRKEVQAAIDDLQKKVGKIKVTLNVDGAEVLVDDVSVGVSPLAAPVTVNAGRRKVSATSSGYTPAQRVVDVSATDETPVTLELTKIGAATPPPVEAPVPPKPSFPLYTWGSLAATGATTLVTVVLGGLAVSAHGSLETALGPSGNPTTLADARSRTKTFANATDAFIGITAAGAVATAALFVFGPRAAATEPAKPAATVGVSPAGIVVRGVF
jgi:PEGA domain